MAANEVIVRAAAATVHLAVVRGGKVLYNFDREATGTLAQTLLRIRKRASVPDGDRVDIGDLCAAIRDGQGAIVSDTTPNSDAFAIGHVLHLGSEVFPLRLNPPSVVPDSMRLGLWPLCGFPQIATATLEYSKSLEHCKWKWFLAEPSSPEVKSEVGQGRSYTPRPEDAGKSLIVELTPVSCAGDLGLPVTMRNDALSGSKKRKKAAGVDAGTQILSGPLPRSVQRFPVGTLGFRAMSYNILVDRYISGEWCLTNLYPYCTQKFAHEDYRRQLIVRDIVAAEPDVVALQEVSRGLFKHYLRPLLKIALNLDGAYTERADEGGWGMATFWRADRWTSRSYRVDLQQSAPFWREHKVVGWMCKQDASLADHLSITKTTAQVVELSPVEGQSGDPAARGAARPLVIVNMHLFSHPMAPHVRMIQAAHLLGTALPELLSGRTSTGTESEVLVAGDLNAGSSSGVVEFLKRGCVGEDHPEWAEGAAFASVQCATKDEREENWYRVLRETDALTIRRIFSALDRQHTGSVARSTVAEAIGKVNTAILPLEVRYVDLYAAMHTWKVDLGDEFDVVLEAAAAKTAEGEVPDVRSVGEFAKSRLEHPYKLVAVPGPPVSYCAGAPPLPQVVDHMLGGGLRLAAAVRFAEAEEIVGGIPNEYFPSDHVPLLADFTYAE